MQKVMLVDDSTSVRRNLEHLLKKFFVEETKFITAEDGDIAFKLIEENQDVQIIFMDLNMPNCSGDVLLQKLRSLERYKKVLIFMLTADNLPEVTQKLKSLGANHVLYKPYTFESISQSLKSIMDANNIRIMAELDEDF